MNKMIKKFASIALLTAAALGVQAQETTTPDGTSYAGYLNISMMGEPVATNQKSTVQITATDEGKCNFLLPDLTLEGLGSLGDIALTDVSVEKDFFGNSTYTKAETSIKLLEDAISAKVSLNGTISNMGEVTMNIPVIWDASEMGAGDININVTFSTKPVGVEYSGYLNISLGDDAMAVNAKASVFIVGEAEGKCDFLLPDLTIPDLGSLGDIALPEVSVEKDFFGNSTYTKAETTMELLEGAIKAKVSLNGTISNMGEVTMNIPVIWDASEMGAGDIPISVTFSTTPAGSPIGGYLSIGFADAAPMEINTKTTVYIIDTTEGECNFLLPNLTILGGFMDLGDIALTGVKISEKDGITTYTHEGTPMNIYLQGQELTCTVKLNGTVDADGNTIMEIPVIWHIPGDPDNDTEGQDIPINVSFSSTPVGTAIDGYLTIGFEGAEPMETDTPATIYITDTDEGVCNFLLPDLTIMGGFMDLGDIALTGVKVAEEGNVTTYTHEGSPMNIYLQGQELNCTVKLNGTVDADGNTTMEIPVIWHIPADPDSETEAQDLPINVKFSTQKQAGMTIVETENDNVVIYGVEGAVKVAGVEGIVSVYSTTGAKVAEANVDGEATIEAPKGIAIVATPARTAKVVVK